MRTRIALALAALLLASGGAFAGTGPEARLACPSPTTTFAGAPAPLGEPTPPTTLVRDDPDGLRTLVLAIDEPFVGTYAYTTTSTPTGQQVTTYNHDWQAPDRNLVSVGILVGDVRVPLVIFENVDTNELIGGAQVATDALVHAAGALLSNLDPAHFDDETREPDPDPAPSFVWNSYRRVEGREVWTGFAHTRQSHHEENPWDGASCTRLEILSALRTEAGTTSGGGLYVNVFETHDTEGGDENVYGLSAGATTQGVDSPSAWASVRERQREHMDTREEDGLVSIGVTDERGDYRPLVGARLESTHAAAPDAFESMLSVGVFRADGAYFPQVGSRAHFERYAPVAWLDVFLATGGPGSQFVGDWETDVGVFDPFARFVPLAGVAYDDSLDAVGRADVPTNVNARHLAQSFVSAGAWALDTYQPLVGATYDGEVPLLAARAADGSRGDWLVSAGVFAPLAGYAPLAGASFDTEPGITELYTVGTFAGSYDAYVPLAGARWSSDRQSLTWIGDHDGRAPSDATIEAGPMVTDELVPLVRADVEAGDVDHYHVSLFTGTGFTRLASACMGSRDVGIAIADDPILALERRVPSPSDTTPPEARPLETCA